MSTRLDRIIIAIVFILAATTTASMLMLRDVAERMASDATGADATLTLDSNTLLERAIEATTLVLVHEYGKPSDEAAKWAEWLVPAARVEGVPVQILIAVVATESSFRTAVRSNANAIGPAQVRPLFWASYCDTDIDTPEGNIRCAAKVLAHYRDRCGGSWENALACYNVGPRGLRLPGGEAAAERYLAKIRAAMPASMPTVPIGLPMVASR
jgi:soluble lytic murein transglycosylase-like protein